ncbi:MAG: hypothetical protein M3R06_07785 [Chloroflexota bacterium]|nr:hypothetical protein [Chloroflexota bacterium]
MTTRYSWLTNDRYPTYSGVMPERSSRAKRPRNLDQFAASIVDMASDDEPQPCDTTEPEKNPHAAALGRLGGQKGGPARALKLSAERRREIAKKAATARWHGTQEAEQGG